MNKPLKPINLEGYEDYAIDEDGDIYSYKKNRWLKKRIAGTCEYYMTSLRIKGKRVDRLNHRLCAIAWLPLPDGSTDYDKWMVCHKDNNKLNINKDNLYWGTNQTNMIQMYRDKIWDINDAKKYKKNKRDYKVYINDKLVGVFHSYKEIINTLGIPNTTIYRLIRNKTAYNKYNARIEVKEPEE